MHRCRPGHRTADREGLIGSFRVPPRIRLLGPDDAAAAVAVIHAAFAAQEVVTDPPPGALKENADSLRVLIEAGGGAAAERDGLMAAVVVWREAEGGLYFGRLAVLPSVRGQGLARLLVGAAEDEARRRGLPRLHCGVRLMLPGNHALFRSLGFHEFRRVPDPKYGRIVSADLEKLL